MMVELQFEALFLVLREDALLEDVSDDVFQAWSSFWPGVVYRRVRLDVRMAFDHR